MSGPAAIATVTATLQHLLDQATTANDVTTLSPAIAREVGVTSSQLNIFLYGVETNTAFSNFPMPGARRANESSPPPLALTLKYLLTAYGTDDDDISSQQIIGEAMTLFHDHPVFSHSDIEGISPDSDLQEQIARVRITSVPMPLDDMTKLWNTFQTGYRLSHAYEASVALIESEKPARTPLPVLMRGAHDAGVNVQTGLLPPYPTLQSVIIPDDHVSIVAGETLTLSGHHLDAPAVALRFTHARIDTPIEITAATINPEQLTVQIPDPPTGWLSGTYAVDALLTGGDQPRTSNAIAMTVAPTLSNFSVIGGGNQLSIDVSPGVDVDQRITLLLDGQEITDFSSPAAGTLVFDVSDAPAGDYFVRVRIDGIDSRLINLSAEPPLFDAAMEVTLP